MQYKGCDLSYAVIPEWHRRTVETIDDALVVLGSGDFDGCIFSENLFRQFFSLWLDDDSLKPNGMKLLASLDLDQHEFLVDVDLVKCVLDVVGTLSSVMDHVTSFLCNEILAAEDKRPLLDLLVERFPTLEICYSNTTHLHFLHALLFFLDTTELQLFAPAIPSIVESALSREPNLQDKALDCLIILSSNPLNIDSSLLERELTFAAPTTFAKLLQLIMKTRPRLPESLTTVSFLSRFDPVLPFATRAAIAPCLSFLARILDEAPSSFLSSNILTVMLDAARSGRFATSSAITIFLLSHLDALIALPARSDHIHSVVTLFFAISDALDDDSVAFHLPAISTALSLYPDLVPPAAFVDRVLLMTADSGTADVAQDFLELHVWPNE